MAKILIIDIDSTIPNLALKKVELYHLNKGDSVTWNMPLDARNSDKIYVSCIFPENRFKCLVYENFGALIGGTGYDKKIKLPPEIDAVKPKINWGFTTRGCIRHCDYCFVPEKEGSIHVVGDIYDIWDGVSDELYIMDNNILALPEHFMKIASQLKKEKLKVDFNQGLDHRLLTPELWAVLKSLKHIDEIRFAFDKLAYKKSVIKALEIMKAGGLRNWRTRWYVYVGKKDTYDTVFERLKILKVYKQHAYLMRDREVIDNPVFTALAQWCNTAGAFKMDLPRLLNESEKMKRYSKYFPESAKEGYKTKLPLTLGGDI